MIKTGPNNALAFFSYTLCFLRFIIDDWTTRLLSWRQYRVLRVLSGLHGWNMSDQEESRYQYLIHYVVLCLRMIERPKHHQPSGNSFQVHLKRYKMILLSLS